MRYLMKWALHELSVDDNQKMYYESSINLDMKDFSYIERLIDIDTLHINGVWYYDDINDHLYTEFNLSGDITVSGSLTLNEFVHHIDAKATEVFAFDQIDEIADHLIENNEVDLLPIIKQIVVANIPVKIEDENLEYPKGDGWEVISDQDFADEEPEVNPKMAKLLELELAEDD